MGFVFGWLHDRRRMVETITHPDVWPWISFDDACPEDFVLPMHISCLGAWVNGEYVGMFTFESISAQCWRCHVHLLPGAKGYALILAKDAIELLHNDFPALCLLVGETPSMNRLAVGFKKRLGFQEVGRLRDAVTQRGEVQDLIISEYRVR